jgi:hypothetical protein
MGAQAIALNMRKREVQTLAQALAALLRHLLLGNMVSSLWHCLLKDVTR